MAINWDRVGKRDSLGQKDSDVKDTKKFENKPHFCSAVSGAWKEGWGQVIKETVCGDKEPGFSSKGDGMAFKDAK